MLDAFLDLAARLAPLSFLVGVVMLLAGGHWLVEGSVAIARRLGMSTLLIGLTIVACGTSAPELFFNVAAAISGQGDLSFGNVVGSNIANLGLVLGAAAFVAPLAVHRSVLRRDLPILLVASALLPLLAWLPASRPGPNDSGFGWIDGIILLACFIGVLGAWIISAIRGGAEVPVDVSEVDQTPERPLGVASLLFAAGLATLIVGGKGAEIGATGIARAAGLSPGVIGLTIVAVATSLPEVVTSVVAVRRGHADLAVGNVVGSNLFNILFVLGTTTLFGTVQVPAGGWTDLTVMLVLTGLLVPFAATNGRQVLRWQGAVLLTGWAAAMAWSVIREVFGPGATG
ncbi:MAG: calcium/sodium antiporter [Planctomycetota bacterium]|jgi:cation:H+ antiporter